MAVAAAATPRPWSAHEDGDSIWIQGPEGSGDVRLARADRRIVCDFRIYGDAALDAETRANMALIVERVNAGETA